MNWLKYPDNIPPDDKNIAVIFEHELTPYCARYFSNQNQGWFLFPTNKYTNELRRIKTIKFWCLLPPTDDLLWDDK